MEQKEFGKMTGQGNSNMNNQEYLTYFIRNNGPFHVINEENSPHYETFGGIAVNKHVEPPTAEKSRGSKLQKILKKNGASAEEIHRVKQREQYKRMLNNMEHLIQVLPNVQEYKKQKTKQFVLSEAYQYIHFLQLCIYHLAKENGSSDKDILKTLHWEQECTNVGQCMSRISANLAKHSNCKREQCCTRFSMLPMPLTTTVHSSPAVHVEKNNGQDRTEHLRQGKSRKMKRKSLKGKKMTTSSKKQTDLIYRNKPNSNSGGCVSSTSPVQSRRIEIQKSAKEKKIEDNTQTMKSPIVIPFHVISPPSSYRRTIIQDSPQEPTVTKHWNEVSVRSCSPWMPKPDCVYETIEDLAEEIVENYGRHTSSNDDDDTEEDDCTDHLMTSSFSTVSFLDSSFSDEEETHHQPIRLKTEDLNKEDLAQIQTDSYCHKKEPESWKISTNSLSTVSPPQETFRSPQYYSNMLNEGFSSPEHLLGFSPRMFLTGRRLTEAK